MRDPAAADDVVAAVRSTAAWWRHHVDAAQSPDGSTTIISGQRRIRRYVRQVYCSGPPADSGAETYDGRVDVPPISHHEYARRDRRTDGRIDRRRDGRPMLCAFRYADGPRGKQTSTRAHCALPIGFLMAPPPQVCPKRHLDWFCRFCTAHWCAQHIQTTETYGAIGRIYASNALII